MGFFDKFRAAVSRFMSGRYGSDQLNLTMVIGALIVTTIGSLSGVYFLTLAADALLLLAIFRMFSKDRYRRAHENQVYLEKTQKVRRAATEWVNRVKNSRKYHYYTRSANSVCACRAASETSPSPAKIAAQNSIRKRKLPKRAVRELHT